MHKNSQPLVAAYRAIEDLLQEIDSFVKVNKLGDSVTINRQVDNNRIIFLYNLCMW